MKWYISFLGHYDEEEYWALTRLLHDVDFEAYPEEHCIKTPELLAEINAGEELIRSICSHGYELCCDIEPVHQRPHRWKNKITSVIFLCKRELLQNHFPLCQEQILGVFVPDWCTENDFATAPFLATIYFIYF